MYIHKENQTLLWNAVNKIPEFHQLSVEQREIRFKQTIHQIYESNRDVAATQELLKQMNRDTILYLRQLVSLPIMQPKLQTVAESFASRQNEYKIMAPALPDITFDRVLDEPIQNMDELVRMQKQERDLDFSSFSSFSSPPVPPIATMTNSNSVEKQLQDIRENIQQVMACVEKIQHMLEEKTNI